MSETEEELYTYLLNLSRVRASVLSFISGFTFTVITIFLNQLPDVTSVMSQATLFLLTLLFEFFLFLLAWQMIIVIGSAPARIVYAANAHVFKRETSTFNRLMLLAFSLWGMSVMLMFLLWNLPYLALASSVVWIFVITTTYSIVRKRTRASREWGKSQRAIDYLKELKNLVDDKR